MIAVSEVSIVGDSKITDNLFGGNLLAPTVPLEGEGSYAEAIDYLGVDGLRFPGGSLTEYVFDITNPDQPIVYNPDLDVTWNMIGLTDFMNFANENGHPVTIVIPTRTQLTENTDENGDRFAEVDEQDLRKFIGDLVGGEYGPAQVQAIEIGNEYWGSGQMNALEYGRVASKMSQIIDDELSQLGNYDVDIIVQKGNNYDYSRLSDDYEGVSPSEALSDINFTYSLNLDDSAMYSDGTVNWAYVNARIVMSEFDTEEEWDSIDGVVTHVYSRGPAAETTRYFDLDQINKTWIEEKPELEIYITEWNLKSEPNLNRDDDYGLFQAQEMLEIMEEFVRTGVDKAHVWPLIQNTANPLAEGTEFTAATAPGEMFALMSESLPGKVLLDLNPVARDTEFQAGNVSTHMFAGEGELVLYVMNGSKETGATADIDLSGFVSDYGGIEALVLGVAEGSGAGDTSSPPTIDELGPEVIVDGYLEATLSPGEVMQVVLTDLVPSDAFAPVWDLANTTDPFVTIEEDGAGDTDDFPFPTVDVVEDDPVVDEPEADDGEDDEGFGLEYGLALIILMGLSGFGLG